MKMSDSIAAFIMDCLSDGGGVAELQRRGLAERFSCVPSQINYVIETRFTPEHGYLVESRRGGGGYIRIARVQYKQRMLLEAARAVGGTDEPKRSGEMIVLLCRLDCSHRARGHS